MKNLALIVNSTGCTIATGTNVVSIASDHPNYEAIQDAYAEGDVEQVEKLISISKTINALGQGVVRVESGNLYYGDRQISNGLSGRILAMFSEGRENAAKPLIAFLENVMLNPSFRAVDGLYDWLERSKLPITTDGHFLAWKVVENNYLDCYTGTFDNSVGCVVQIERNEVDENPNRTCSHGLHFCSNEYIKQFMWGSRRLMLVKVNPRDVGAFPHDYNISKGRCCRYEVIDEVNPGDCETKFDDVKSGVVESSTTKLVEKITTRSLKDRQEIDLVFMDGSIQKTKVRLGNTTSHSQKGNTITLHPSGRTIEIV